MVILSKNITLCRSFLKKGTGLMFKKYEEDFAYVFTFSKPKILVITMIFVFYHIDILFLREGKIVEIAKEVRPFGSYIPKELADTFIEFPAGKIKKSMLGMNVRWDPSIVEITHK